MLTPGVTGTLPLHGTGPTPPLIEHDRAFDDVHASVEDCAAVTTEGLAVNELITGGTAVHESDGGWTISSAISAKFGVSAERAP